MPGNCRISQGPYVISLDIFGESVNSLFMKIYYLFVLKTNVYIFFNVYIRWLW